MKKQLFFAVLFLGFTFSLLAQRTISGTLTDEKGEPLVGGSVVLKGSTMGVLTDIDGKYSMNLPNNAQALTFSFIGYATKELEIKDTTRLDNVIIQLEETACQLSICTIIAYKASQCIRYCGCGVLTESGCCFCCGVRFNCLYTELPISARALPNGTTQLAYNIDVSWWGKNRGISRQYEEKTVYYRISKSTDNVHFKKIGNSISDTVIRVQERWDSTLVKYGVSQFLDREKTDADSIFYEVEGYTLEDDADDDEPQIETIVFKQKTSVAPVKQLTINNLYATTEANQIELTVSSPKEGAANFKVFDISGRVLAQYQNLLVEKQNTVVLSNCNLISGTYILSVSQGEQVATRKFVVVK